MYQAATQVNGFSPDINHVVDADTLHNEGRQYQHSRSKRDYIESTGVLNSSMMQDGFCVNLGEPQNSLAVKRGEYVISSRSGQGMTNGFVVVGLTDSTPSRGKLCAWGSGQRCCNGFSVGFLNTQRLN